MIQLIESNIDNLSNNYFVVTVGSEAIGSEAAVGRSYVLLHIIKGKYAIYDYEFHDVVKCFKWQANNGYACCLLKDEHFEKLPDLPFQKNKLVYMHTLIQEYCLKIPSPVPSERYVLHHINERCRDNRKENMIWVSNNQHRALMIKVGKLYKPPSEIRVQMPELPPFCRWINAKKLFRIDSHPACFLAVEKNESVHKYIDSLKSKKYTIQEKFNDFIKKWYDLIDKPYGGHASFPKYLEFKTMMENSYKELQDFASFNEWVFVENEASAEVSVAGSIYEDATDEISISDEIIDRVIACDAFGSDQDI